MTHLVVSKPARPMKFAENTRLQYRVVLDNKKMHTLKEVATQIGVPYPSLAARVHKELSTVGIYTTEFLNIVADVKKRARINKQPSERCPHCKGLGRIPLVEPSSV